MNESEEIPPHAPTPEFRASLEREIARSYRSDLRFGQPRGTRLRRVGMIAGLAAGGVITLTVGLILGASTGYASAEEIRKENGDTTSYPRPPLAIIPIRSALNVLACGSAGGTAPVKVAQKAIPVIDVPAAAARTAQTLGGVLGIHQTPDGKVIVNDAARRQLKVFDSTLAVTSILMDSAPGTSTSYGPRPTPLIAYVGDSSLFPDWKSRTMLVLDPIGRVARALALPSPRDFLSMTSSFTGVDNKGRIIFKAERPRNHDRGPAGMMYADSVTVVRADLDFRQVDTIARLARPLMKVITEKSSDGKTSTIYVLDPLQPVDEWTVLSNGSVALVRGRDYHIDWLHPDGSAFSSPKMPFDWKRLSDGDKDRLADSVRAGQNALLAIGYPSAEFWLRSPCADETPGRGGDGEATGRGGGRSGGSGAAPPPGADSCTEMLMNAAPPIGAAPTRPPRPPLLELLRAGPIADYEPAIRLGSALADADGNLWVLPRVSTLSKSGELVYDVVNTRGEVFERVRLPAGRAIAGFGKGGVMYLTSGDRTSGYYLERSTLPKAR